MFSALARAVHFAKCLGTKPEPKDALLDELQDCMKFVRDAEDQAKRLPPGRSLATPPPLLLEEVLREITILTDEAKKGPRPPQQEAYAQILIRRVNEFRLRFLQSRNDLSLGIPGRP